MFDRIFYACEVDTKNKLLSFKGTNVLSGFVLSFLAGLYIGFGLLLSITVGGLLKNTPFCKIGMGMTFGIGLLFVIFCGAELFTGNNLILGTSIFKKKLSCVNCLIISFWCLLGNLVGSIFLGRLFIESGLCSGNTLEIIRNVSIAKTILIPEHLVIRGILCNMLVCLAVWAVKNLKEEVAKIIMVSWSLFVFVTCGFEHSIANMSLLYIAFSQHIVGIMPILKNLLFVTIGNVIGGLLIAFLYSLVDFARKK